MDIPWIDIDAMDLEALCVCIYGETATGKSIAGCEAPSPITYISFGERHRKPVKDAKARGVDIRVVDLNLQRKPSKTEEDKRKNEVAALERSIEMFSAVMEDACEQSAARIVAGGNRGSIVVDRDDIRYTWIREIFFGGLKPQTSKKGQLVWEPVNIAMRRPLSAWRRQGPTAPHLFLLNDRVPVWAESGNTTTGEWEPAGPSGQGGSMRPFHDLELYLTTYRPDTKKPVQYRRTLKKADEHKTREGEVFDAVVYGEGGKAIPCHTMPVILKGLYGGDIEKWT